MNVRFSSRRREGEAAPIETPASCFSRYNVLIPLRTRRRMKISSSDVSGFFLAMDDSPSRHHTIAGAPRSHQESVSQPVRPVFGLNLTKQRIAFVSLGHKAEHGDGQELNRRSRVHF